MSAKNATKSIAQNDNNNGKVPTVESAPAPFDFNATLASAEKDVEAAFTALLLHIASQAAVEAVGPIVPRLADVLDGEGKAPAAKYDPSGSALHKRLKRLFGSKGVLTICNMARVIVDRAPIIG